MFGWFYLLGLIGGICFTIMDFTTSMKGMAALMSENSMWRGFAPPVMASMALAMNASASKMVTYIYEQKETQFSVFLIGLAFVVCVIFDASSSFIGCVTDFSGSPDFATGWQTSGTGLLIFATAFSVFITIGPLLVARFYDMIVQEGGIMACVAGPFSQTRTEIVEVEE